MPSGDQVPVAKHDDLPAPALPVDPATAAGLGRAAALMATLRGPDGCPWDREQTFDSIKRHTLEETYEVFDAIERRAWPDLKDELGDLLLQVLFYSQMAADAGYFTLRDVADNLTAKLIRRHPHIFGNASAGNAAAVLRQWEQVKQQERASRPPNAGEAQQPAGLLDSIPRSMPAPLEASKLGSKAAKVGFDWPDAAGHFAKLKEETAELHAEIVDANTDRIEAEMGDLLFTAMQLARHLHVDPESALRRTNARFRERFAAMERAVPGGSLAGLPPEQLEDLWAAAKQTVASRNVETGA